MVWVLPMINRNEIDQLRAVYDESVGEKRRTILSISFTGDHTARYDLEPCTLEEVISKTREIESDGITVPASNYSPRGHSGASVMDVAFRHHPRTIIYIEIIRRRAWKVEDET